MTHTTAMSVYTAYPNPVWETPLTLENICSELIYFNVFDFFTMDDAAGKVIEPNIYGFDVVKSSVTSLRLVSKEMKWNVEHCPWNDLKKPYFRAWGLPSRVIGSLASWKACFPYACSVNLCLRRDLTDADFQTYLTEVSYLLMRGCDQETLTDKAFSNLPYLIYVDMKYCNQPTITEKAFDHFGINRSFTRITGKPSHWYSYDTF
jgi:hypothetical protein